MSIFYMDYVNGSDSNSGADWSNAKKTINGFTSAIIAPGDTIRIAKSPDPTLIGNVTWTNVSKTVTIPSNLVKTVSMCEDDWVAGTGSTVAYSTTLWKEGSRSLNLTTDGSVTTPRLLAYYPLPSITDFSSYRQLSFWICNIQALTAGLLQVCLCSDAGGTVVVDTINVPVIASSNVGWIPITVDKGSTLGPSIQSVAIYCTASFASKQVYFDNIIACKSPSSNDSISLTSLIGKDLNISRTSSVKYPSAVSNDSAIGTTAWTNLSNVGASDDVYAQNVVSSSNGISNYLHANSFGFALDTDAVILGIKVEVEKKASDSNKIKDYEVKIVRSNGSIGDVNKASSSYWTTSDAYSVYGGLTDLWGGETWTATDINDSDFGVVISVTNTDPSNAYTAYVDNIRVSIAYKTLDGWYAIQSINGTTAYIDSHAATSTPQVIRGYYGDTEECSTYKREGTQVTIASGTGNYAFATQDSGSAGNYIMYEGGYNTISNTIDGQTWFDIQSSSSHGIYVNQHLYLYFKNIGIVRASVGWLTYHNVNTNMYLKFENCHANNCSSHGFSQTYLTWSSTYYDFKNCTFNNNYGNGMIFASSYGGTWEGTVKCNNNHVSHGIYYGNGTFYNSRYCVIRSCNNGSVGIYFSTAAISGIPVGELQLHNNAAHGWNTTNGWNNSTFYGNIYANYNGTYGFYFQHYNNTGTFSCNFLGKIKASYNGSANFYSNYFYNNRMWEEIDVSYGATGWNSPNYNNTFDKKIYANNNASYGLIFSGGYTYLFKDDINVSNCGTGLQFTGDVYNYIFDGIIYANNCSVGIYSGYTRHMMFNKDVYLNNCSSFSMRFQQDSSYPPGTNTIFNGNVYMNNTLGSPYYGSYGIYHHFTTNTRFNGITYISGHGADAIHLHQTNMGDMIYFSRLEITNIAGAGIYCEQNVPTVYVKSGKVSNCTSWGVYALNTKVYLSNFDFSGQQNEAAVGNEFSDGAIYSNKHDLVVRGHKTFVYGGIIQSDMGTVRTSGISWRLSPLTTYRTQYYPLVMSVGKIAFRGGYPVSVSLWFRKNDVNINAQLVIPKYQEMSLISDLIATMSNAVNTWEKLTLNFTPLEDCVIEIEARTWGGSIYNVWVSDLEVTQ